MNISSLVQIKNAKKVYKNTILRYENIEIKNRVTLLVGSNGSGKSTLIKMINDVIQYDGEILSNVSTSYMPEVATFPKDVFVNIFLEQLCFLQKIENSSFLKLLDLFQLTTKITEPIYSLSKGMKAKLNLIQCLMKPADLYILDEPLSGLDYQAVETLVDYIKDSEKSFLISSHISSAFEEVVMEVITL